jgi:hypothetical protein
MLLPNGTGAPSCYSVSVLYSNSTQQNGLLRTTRRNAVSLGMVALGLVVLVLGGAFAYYFLTASGTISSQSSQISSLVSQVSTQSSQVLTLGVVSSLQSSQISSQSGVISSQSAQISNQSAIIANKVAQIAADSMQISNLTSMVGSLGSQVSSLQSSVTADRAQIQLLLTEYAAANQTVASLNSQIASLNSQIASLNGQISTLNGEVAADQAQISALQAQVSSLQSILGLASHVTVYSAFTYLSIQQVPIKVFTANYSGYLAMSVTYATDYSHEGGNIHIGFASNVNASGSTGMYLPGPSSSSIYVFPSVPSTLIFPVTPGTITVYLDTSDFTSQSAAVTVIYYY